MTLLFNPNVIGAGLNAGYAADQDIQVLTEKMRLREEARFLREYNTYNDLVAKDRYNKAINDGLGPQKAAQAMAGAGYAGLAPGLKASNDLANSAAAGYENARAVEGQAAEQDGIFSPFRKGDRPGTIARGEYYGGNGTIVDDRRYDAKLEANKAEAARIRAEATRINIPTRIPASGIEMGAQTIIPSIEDIQAPVIPSLLPPVQAEAMPQLKPSPIMVRGVPYEATQKWKPGDRYYKAQKTEGWKRRGGGR